MNVLPAEQEIGEHLGQNRQALAPSHRHGHPAHLGQVLPLGPARFAGVPASPIRTTFPSSDQRSSSSAASTAGIGYRAVRSARPIRAWVCKNRRTIVPRASSSGPDRTRNAAR